MSLAKNLSKYKRVNLVDGFPSGSADESRFAFQKGFEGDIFEGSNDIGFFPYREVAESATGDCDRHGDFIGGFTVEFCAIDEHGSDARISGGRLRERDFQSTDLEKAGIWAWEETDRTFKGGPDLISGEFDDCDFVGAKFEIGAEVAFSFFFKHCGGYPGDIGTGGATDLVGDRLPLTR